jgi:hypothetical protein
VVSLLHWQPLDKDKDEENQHPAASAFQDMEEGYASVPFPMSPVADDASMAKRVASFDLLGVVVHAVARVVVLAAPWRRLPFSVSRRQFWVATSFWLLLFCFLLLLV